MVSNTYCVVFLFCFSSSCVLMLSVSLDCPFWLPLWYSLTFIFGKTWSIMSAQYNHWLILNKRINRETQHCSFCYNESAKTVRVVTRSERNCRAQDCPGVSEIIKKNKECSICVKEKRKKTHCVFGNVLQCLYWSSIETRCKHVV